MKKLALIILSLSIFVSSCNYLDIVPDDTATLNDAFKNETTAESFVFTCYSYLPNYNNFRNMVGMCTSNEYVGAYHWGSEWFDFERFQQGEDNSAKPIADLWSTYYQAIKQCYLFLNNVDKVTPIFMDPTIFANKKKEWIGEVYFLLAYYHNLLLQNYGPVVIVEKELTENQPRLPFDECVTKIVGMYNKAMENLPLRVQPAEYGRASQVVASAMKAKLLLFAASPLFNGNTDYSTFTNKDGTVLINQTYEKEKWNTAMKAIDSAIVLAKSQNHGLYEYTAKPISDPFEKAFYNTRYVVVDNWNPEILWAFTGNKESLNSGNSLQRHSVPKGMANRRYTEASPVGGLSPTLTAAKIFYDKNGVPPENDAAKWAQRMTIAPGDSTIQLHRNREPRFYAAIGFDRGIYEFNGDQKYTLYLRFNEKNGCAKKETDHLYSGYAVKKVIHPEGQATASAWGNQDYAFPIIRLADLYLAYAEACAEYQGSLNEKAKGYINDVRKRAGIPTLEDAYGSIGDKALVDVIRRERMIELVFEAHWHYDLRRWKMAVDWHNGERAGMWGLNDVGATAEDYYKETRLIERYSLFDKRQYLMPIKTEWVTVNNLLVQNPNW